MIGVCCGIQVVGNSDPGQLQVFAFLFPAKLIRGFAVVAVVPLGRLAGFDLRFYVFAFPSSRHSDSLTHFAGSVGDYERESVKRGLGAGGAASGQNGERGVHHATERAFGDASEVLGKDALVGEFGDVIGPANLQNPVVLGSCFDGVGGKDFGGWNCESSAQMRSAPTKSCTNAGAALPG